MRNSLRSLARPARRTEETAEEATPVIRFVNAILAATIDAQLGELALLAEAEQVRLPLTIAENPLFTALDGFSGIDRASGIVFPSHLLPLVLDRLKYMVQVSLDVRGVELRGMIRVLHLDKPWNITAQFAPTPDGSSEQVTLRLVRASG